MVQRLVDGGSLLAEAEQTIAARKAACNKALREFKKEQTPKNLNNAKKGTRSNRQSSQNGYQDRNTQPEPGAPIKEEHC